MRAMSGEYPVVKTVEEANSSWKLYVPAWKGMLAKDGFSKTMAAAGSRTERNGRLGWLKDISFWQHFWDAFAREHAGMKYSHAGMQTRYQAIMPYLRKAFDAQNMAIFEGAHNPLGLDTLAYALVRHHAILQEPVLEWCRQHKSVYAEVGPAQGVLWRKLPWKKHQGLLSGSPLFGGMNDATVTMDAAIGRMVRGLHEHTHTQEEQVQLLGHFLFNCPQAWHKPTEDGPNLLSRMQDQLQPHLLEGVDLALVALCSGHGKAITETQKEIKALGRALILAGGNHGSSKQVLVEQCMAACTQDMAAVVALYDINSVLDLYKAVQSFGVGKKRDIEVFALPSMEI